MTIQSRLIIGIIIFTMILSSVTSAQDPTTPDITAQSTELALLWENGDYNGVIQGLETLIDTIPEQSVAYINLGNAYWKLNETGQALYHWRRAQLLTPRYTNLNEQIYRARLRVGIEEMQPPNTLVALGTVTETLFSVDELLWLVTLSWLILWGILWAVRRFKADGLIYISVFISLAIIIFVTLLASRLYIYEQNTPAIVLSENVAVFNGANSSYLQLFTLIDGQEVYVMDEQDDWIRILTRDEREGWILRDNVGYIPKLG